MSIPKAQEVKLSDAERQGFEKLVKRHQVGQQIALRARIVLAAADGFKNKEIVAKYAIPADTVRLWRNRWVKLQDISLDDLSKLRFGDQVIVHAFGQRYIYEVHTNYVITPEDMSPFKHEEKAWPTLLTCKGYDESSDTYKYRVQMRAVLVKVTAE